MIGVILFVLRHPIIFYQLWRKLYQLEMAQKRLNLAKDENALLRYKLATRVAEQISSV